MTDIYYLSKNALMTYRPIEFAAGLIRKLIISLISTLALSLSSLPIIIVASFMSWYHPYTTPLDIRTTIV